MAITHSAALAFVDESCRRQMSTRLESLFSCVDVDLAGEEQPQLRIHVSAVGDWWFSSFEGRGEAIVAADRRALQFADHALLTLIQRGQTQPMHRKTLLPPIGHIVLSPWNDADAFVSSGDFSYLCAYVPMAQLEAMAGAKIPFGRPLDAGHGPGALLRASLQSLVFETTRGNASRFVPMLPAFIGLALAALQNEGPVDDDAPGSLRMLRILDYVQAHLADQALSPAEVAGTIGMSKRQLCREFERHGETFAQRLRELRLAKACRLLRDRQRVSITEIAYDCGFTSPTVFGRQFRAAHGLTPQQFRARQDRLPRLS